MNRYQKGKANLDFTEARDSEWQWHQMGHMQVCTSLQTDNHASNPPLNFLQAGCPSYRPTNSVKALKAQAWDWYWKWDVYIVIGTVGVADNLFVLVVFALFIKITDKVSSAAVVRHRRTHTHTHTVSNKCTAVRKVATPLRELTCHVGSHSVTCHPAEVTFPLLPRPKLVLDSATPEGCKAELT